MQTSSRKVEFVGSQGTKLAARLDTPITHPRAYALFAHCFTCSKDVFAASRISSGLAEQGIATLRFDFTGLGASEGEFANSNFSSNIEDLVLAAEHLRENFEAPQLLVGHSLGGPAVLAAAHKIPEIRAIATIGAPAEADHVVHNFGADIERINEDGEAEVSLAGRPFKIKKQFLDDLKSVTLSEHVSNLKKALLVFHAPLDDIVGIENAGRIFSAAKHPKSFISLDQADHLLTKKADAVYVADVLANWASRYLDEAPEAEETKPQLVTVAETGFGKFQQIVTSGQHKLMADEPKTHGGLDTGPSPYDFLAIALGACTSMTLRMYADFKKLELGKITVTVDHEKIHAEDCADCGEGKSGRLDRFERVISIDGEVSPEISDKLIEIAGKCPVHKTLEASSVVVTKTAE